MSNIITSSGNNVLTNVETLDVSSSDADYLNASISDIKEQLALFKETESNNSTSSDSNALNARLTELQTKKDALEAEMAELQEEILEKKDETAKHADLIEELMSSSVSATKEYTEDVKSAVKTAIAGALHDFNTPSNSYYNKKGSIAANIQNYLNLNSNIKNNSTLNAIMNAMNSEKSAISGLCEELGNIMDKSSLLETKYTSLASVYKVISGTLTQVGKTETSYTNADYNTNVPIYTTDQALYISGLAEKYQTADISLPSGNDTESKELTYTDKVQNLLNNEDFAKILNEAKASNGGGNDSYSSDNPTIGLLSELVSNDDFKKEFANQGFSQQEASKFFADYFSSANVSYDEANNKLTVPYGHGTVASNAFTSMKNLINDCDTSTFLGKPNGHNTIDTNPYLELLSSKEENGNTVYENLFKDMSSQGYTFKEAMYALFGSNSNGYKGLFADSGIVYDLDNQKENNANYTFNLAGDSETVNLYKGISEEIYKYWQVNPSNGDGTIDMTNDGEEASISRTDPISFKYNNKEYAFIIDRNNDNKFNDINEFVGGDSSSNWVSDLLTFDSDNDGILSGDELKQVRLLGTETDINGSDTSASDNRNVNDTNTVNIKYSNATAEELGIESINLNPFLNEDGSVNKDTINKQTGTDINGSTTYSDSFSFEINGEDVVASRKDDTSDYLNTVYKDATGRSETIGGLNVDKIVNEANEEYWDKLTGITDEFKEDINVVMNADSFAENMQQAKDRAVNDAEKYISAKKTETQNSKYAQENRTSWSEMQTQILAEAKKAGITADESFMEQAKGYYTHEAINKTAAQIVSEISENNKIIDDYENEKNTSTRSKAMDFVMSAYKKGYNKSISLAEAENAVKNNITVEEYIANQE